MLDALGDGVVGPVGESSGDWQPVAETVLAALTTSAHRAGT